MNSNEKKKYLIAIIGIAIMVVGIVLYSFLGKNGNSTDNPGLDPSIEGHNGKVILCENIINGTISNTYLVDKSGKKINKLIRKWISSILFYSSPDSNGIIDKSNDKLLNNIYYKQGLDYGYYDGITYNIENYPDNDNYIIVTNEIDYEKASDVYTKTIGVYIDKSTDVQKLINEMLSNNDSEYRCKYIK